MSEYRTEYCKGCWLEHKLLGCSPHSGICKDRKGTVNPNTVPQRHIDVFCIAQAPVQYLVWSEDGKERAGYCLITASIKEKPGKIELIGRKNAEQYKEAAIWHIYIDEKFRGKGYGATLLEALKATYDTIYSQALTKDGKKLLMANGFVREGTEKIPIFRWWKKKK
jgi:ribosomal protein S18 acetylase RimI-like enzyme